MDCEHRERWVELITYVDTQSSSGSKSTCELETCITFLTDIEYASCKQPRDPDVWRPALTACIASLFCAATAVRHSFIGLHLSIPLTQV